MWIFADDPGCSAIIKEYGEYSELELDLLKHYGVLNGTVLDVGAHVGAFTVPLSRLAARVVAFEPQREARELLERNVELAGCQNVEIRSEALGWEPSKAYYSLARSSWKDSHGSVMMEPEPFEGAEEAQVVTLDSLNLSPTCMKVDAEGMEIHILAGGRDTIMRHRPFMLIERPTNPEKEEAQIQVLSLLKYYVYRLDVPGFVADNFNRSAHNIHGRMAHMMQMCIPGPLNG